MDVEEDIGVGISRAEDQSSENLTYGLSHAGLAPASTLSLALGNHVLQACLTVGDSRVLSRPATPAKHAMEEKQRSGTFTNAIRKDFKSSHNGQAAAKGHDRWLAYYRISQCKATINVCGTP